MSITYLASLLLALNLLVTNLQAQELSQEALLRQDLSDMRNLNVSGASEVNQSYHNIFTKVFGGSTHVDVLNFIGKRVSGIVTTKQIFEDTYFTPSKTQLKNSPTPWLNINDILSVNLDRAWAYNPTIQLWLISKLNNNINVELEVIGRKYPILQPKSGLIILGKLYSETKQNQTETLQEERFASIIHEARHSDCTGGMPESLVRSIKKLKIDSSTNEPIQKLMDSISKTSSCGHFHTKCPRGHEYEGQKTCDKDIFGPYTVESIYLASTLNHLSSYKRRAAQSIIAFNNSVSPKPLSKIKRSDIPDLESLSD